MDPDALQWEHSNRPSQAMRRSTVKVAPSPAWAFWGTSMWTTSHLIALPSSLKQRWARLAAVEQLYVVGIVGAIAGLATEIIGPKNLIGGWILTASLFFASIGIILECYKWLISRKDHPLSKAGAMLVAVVAATLAAGAGAMVVAQATGQDANYFRISVTAIAPFAFILFLAIATAIASLFGIFVVLLAGSWRKSPGVFLPARCLGLIGLIGGAIYVLLPGSAVDRSLRWAAGYSAYSFDMYPDQACSAVVGDRIARLNDDIVIIGRITDAGPRFVRRACLLAPELTFLAPPRTPTKPVPQTQGPKRSETTAAGQS